MRPSMFPFLCAALACLPLAAHAAATAALPDKTAPGKILTVVSGEGRDQGKTRPGFEFDGFAQAYLIFRDNGFAVEVASPSGGAVQADKYDPNEPLTRRP